MLVFILSVCALLLEEIIGIVSCEVDRKLECQVSVIYQQEFWI
jgi:hypothetical protein